MSGDMLPGRLPDRTARLVLASGEYPQLEEGLRRVGVLTVKTAPDKRLPLPIQWHPDMQACTVGGRVIVLRGSGLYEILAGHDIPAVETIERPKPAYPGDVLCNILAWDRFVLGNYRTADLTVKQAAGDICADWIDVKQGYAACAAALVDRRSAITADEGIAARLEEQGLEVLRISPGDIRLPGYPYGFIGGCCGKLASDMMAFAGRLDSHRDAGRIRDFLNERGIRVVELLDGKLLDVGGLIALC